MEDIMGVNLSKIMAVTIITINRNNKTTKMITIKIMEYHSIFSFLCLVWGAKSILTRDLE
jgi:hypothetical protein